MAPGLKGKPTVLVVDDEEVMREVCAIMVADAGGKAITGIDGLDGVELFAENQESIDCVLIDFSMPNMDGQRAVAEIWKMKGDVPVVFMSGLKRTPEIDELCRSGSVEFLAKPFRAEGLISAINRVIEKKAP